MILRRFARPLLASWFVYEGLGAALRPAEHVAAARAGADLAAGNVEQVPELSDTQLGLLVRAHGVATVVAAGFLAIGKAPRTASLTLAALTVPLAVVNQPFTGNDRTRTERTERFVRNLGAIGAALIAGADYEGRPGVQWRVERARKDLDATRRAKDAVTGVEKSVGRGARRARHAARDARRAALLEARQAQATARRVLKTAQEAVPGVG
ncbi:DoxX-like protein [Sediminihabitans luteus]|uniref:DoxX-like protein n=1 Tax=Sediminihabitans luteus TaxID=1138585 RepID=A0A2M9CDM4_9CELL|nr:DoxX family membrane protein [Sediminihabitans luteus]PJJ70034.1 DoxX-like protein [Sediminihabitans luteus]GIJ00182.1 hypothetical protein Slu03_25590 [Sediminihabitans luteus]